MPEPLPPFNRRRFLELGASSALGILAGSLSARAKAPTQRAPRGLGPLSEHSGALLSLPAGFSYVIIQRAGDLMSDGLRMPPQPDGMACFSGKDGSLILLRNHELGDLAFLRKWSNTLMPYPDGKVPSPRYRDGVYGGVSRLTLDPDALARDLKERPGLPTRALTASNLALAGTDKNCAGGVIDGGWVSCEESKLPGHGYAFMTRPEDSVLSAPRRLTSWGRMKREAVAQDPQSGIVYMTEDHANAAFYRFVPTTRAEPFGEGSVEALAITGLPHTHPYTHAQGSKPQRPRWANKTEWEVSWVRIPDPSAERAPCREQAKGLGATLFRRTEGIAIDSAGVWFVASTGGCAHGGQLFRYIPKGDKGGTLILEHEVEDRRIISSPDNIVLTPWGELLLAEDNYETGGGIVTHQFLRVLNKRGEFYDLARNNETETGDQSPGAEFTGACFSPDGLTLFVNLQTPTQLTLAISGPWPKT